MLCLVRNLLPPHRRGLSVATAALAALGVALLSPAWRVEGQAPSADQPMPVQLLAKETTRPAVSAGNWGATYHWLESQAARVITEFDDAVSTAEREASGDLRVRLADRAGNELATVVVDQLGDQGFAVDLRLPGRQPVRAAGHPALVPTLEWGGRQAYALWKDRENAGRALEWDDTVIRSSGRRADVRSRVVRIRAEWPDGLSAEASHRVEPVGPERGGSGRRRSVLASRLTQGGIDIGGGTWYPEERRFEWSLPGLTEGYVDTARLELVGGWSFEPDLAWLNVQGYAFHRFHSLIAANGFVARKHEGLVDRLVGALVATVHANQPGCDGLHWLDGTMFRPCCDIHDACYEKVGCTWRSWWEFWKSWDCGYCNAGAFLCFTTLYKPYWNNPF